jgi:hypothetical protein
MAQRTAPNLGAADQITSWKSGFVDGYNAAYSAQLAYLTNNPPH